MTKRINAQTKIAELLKGHPDALETIIGLSPAFNKLRNPLLRKLMAGRTTIAMAAKIGSCKPEDFFDSLASLGFQADQELPSRIDSTDAESRPAFMQELQPGQIVDLDVRDMLAGGSDPLKLIQQTINGMQPDQVLKLINTFEPTPLIQLLGRQGFSAYVEHEGPELVTTYFHRSERPKLPLPTVPRKDGESDWDELLARYAGSFVQLDVRQLEMPQPMMTILEALDQLPAAHAIFILHKRIPVFLLDELAARNASYCIREIGPGEVHMLIYRNEA